MSYNQEYYCPHCGAILNDQPGFDPDNGTWECTECGQFLMDDDVYTGDTFEGVAWFCDNCGTLLNRQAGFSDSYGSWKCTECGYINGTTEEDIIQEEDEMNDEESFTCPSCGANLSNQSCFDQYDDDWVCTECGAHLHHEYSDDDYEEIEDPRFTCPNCGAALDSQTGFIEYEDDWICEGCGAHLHHEYSDDDYIEIDEEDDEDDEGDEDDENDKERLGLYSHRSVRDSKQTEGYHSGTRKQNTAYSSQQASKLTASDYGLILFLLLILGLIAFGVSRLFTNKENGYHHTSNADNHAGEVRLVYSASSYEKENYYDAIIKLRGQGLTDIRLTPLNDLKTGILAKEGEIVSIEINGISDFHSGSWVSENSVVSLVYHSFPKKEKKGYDTEKNNRLILHGTDISLPSYFIEDDKATVSAAYYVKGDKETNLLVSLDNYQSWEEIGQYDTHIIQSQEKISCTGCFGETITALGKKNDKVYSLHVLSLGLRDNETYLHLALVSPDTCKTDYTSDYEAMISGIYVSQTTEVLIDFSLKDYKGKNYQEVVADLRSKGFFNIYVEDLHDIVMGVFAKDGEVASILINGGEEYKVGDWISDESEIIVSYHGKK